jgi:DNA-directed RNA polymerase subunit beta
MASTFRPETLRKYFGKIREVLEMPNLIEVQKSSYDLFLNSGDSRARRRRGHQGRFPVGLPDQGFQRDRVLEFVATS